MGSLSLFQRIAWVADSVRDRVWLHRRLAIAPHDLVLDVGSGGSPNLRSNVLCDKFVADSSERHGQSIISDRPFVVGDAARLPFVDKSFDFVICSHVLEHVPDPAAVIRELQRVAPRGYVETPQANWEKLTGFRFHRWLVSLEDGVLVFEKKTARIQDAALAQWFSEFQSTMGLAEQAWFARRRTGVYTSLRWEGEIRCQVRDQRGDDPVFDHAEVVEDLEPAPAQPRGIAARLIQWQGRRLRRASAVPWAEVERRLRCPDCLGRLDSRGSAYWCAASATQFPVDSAGRPCLLAGKHARTSAVS